MLSSELLSPRYVGKLWGHGGGQEVFASPRGVVRAASEGDLAGLIRARDVRFTQDSAGATFKDGRSVFDLADEMTAKGGAPETMPAIRIFEKDGNIHSLDNRRLFAGRYADVSLPYRRARSRRGTPILVHNCNNVISNVEGHDSAGALGAHEPGTAFSGVHDSESGTLRAHLSVADDLPNPPVNAARMHGGHGQINFEHFGGSRTTTGFTMFLERVGR